MSLIRPNRPSRWLSKFSTFRNRSNCAACHQRANQSARACSQQRQEKFLAVSISTSDDSRQRFKLKVAEFHQLALGLQANRAGTGRRSGDFILKHAVDTNVHGVAATDDVALVPFADWLFRTGLAARHCDGSCRGRSEERRVG